MPHSRGEMILQKARDRSPHSHGEAPKEGVRALKLPIAIVKWLAATPLGNVLYQDGIWNINRLNTRRNFDTASSVLEDTHRIPPDISFS